MYTKQTRHFLSGGISALTIIPKINFIAYFMGFNALFKGKLSKKEKIMRFQPKTPRKNTNDSANTYSYYQAEHQRQSFLKK